MAFTFLPSCASFVSIARGHVLLCFFSLTLSLYVSMDFFSFIQLFVSLSLVCSHHFLSHCTARSFDMFLLVCSSPLPSHHALWIDFHHRHHSPFALASFQRQWQRRFRGNRTKREKNEQKNSRNIEEKMATNSAKCVSFIAWKPNAHTLHTNILLSFVATED